MHCVPVPDFLITFSKHLHTRTDTNTHIHTHTLTQQGYKVEFIPEDQIDTSDYTFPVGAGGKRSKETSATFIARPKQPLILYEFQGCPFCAKVREAVTMYVFFCVCVCVCLCVWMGGW